MRVIPVIDLKQGQVVHAVAGRRHEYQPIDSLLCDDPSPESVGAAFHQLGFAEAYVADLDAIAGGPPDVRAYEQLFACGLRLLVDAGLATAVRTRDLAEFSRGHERLAGLVIGLESIVSLPELIASVEIATPSRVVFSLDLRGGVPLARLSQWQALPAESIAEEIVAIGIQRMIVLDLASVGVGSGVSTLGLCQRLKQSHAELEIISGGGVRCRDDLRRMAQAGCDAALVASALHHGGLTEHDLRHFS